MNPAALGLKLRKGHSMKKIRPLLLVLAVALLCQGCVLTKIVTVPMRVAGAVISIIPVAGNTADAAIDEAADAVDKLPI
jgi:hypothetical protein